MGGAVLVTVLTVGGAIGLVPGAALGSTERDPHGSTSPDVPSTDEPSTAADTRDGTRGGGDGGWLTVDPGTDEAPDTDDAPATDPPATDPIDDALPAESGHGRRIVFDMSDQRVWLVDADNTVERTYLVSGSLHDNLQAGTYEVYSMSPTAVSYDGDETMNYMVRFAHGVNAPIGFHDIPAYSDGSLAQTRDDLGTPQSAGCIRQWKPDAKALWNFAEVGTTVVVRS
jgi:hypothetical protein